MRSPFLQGTFCFLLFATPLATTATEPITGSTLLNPDPTDCCTCITLTLGGDLIPDRNGDFTITIPGKVDSDSRCGPVNMTGYTINGEYESATGAMVGKDGEVTIKITAKQAEENEGGWSLEVYCSPDATQPGGEQTSEIPNQVRGCKISFDVRTGCGGNCTSMSTTCDLTGYPDSGNANTDTGVEGYWVSIPTTNSMGGMTSGNLL